jgi:hypothetical protein
MRLDGWLSLMSADQNCFIEDMLACSAFDLAAGWVPAERQPLERERQQAEMIMMSAVLVRRAGGPITGFLEIIYGLTELISFSVLCSALRQRQQVGREVIGHPMMPSAARGIRIVAEKDEAAGSRRRFGPFERLGDILSVAGIEARDFRSMGKGW